jgi:hypothetical protein
MLHASSDFRDNDGSSLAFKRIAETGCLEREPPSSTGPSASAASPRLTP